MPECARFVSRLALRRNLIHELVKGYGLAISRRLRQVHQALKQARDHLEPCQASDPGSEASQEAQNVVAACEAEVSHWQEVRHLYQGHLVSLSLIEHPWRVADSAPQNSQEVQQQLETEIEAVDAFLKTTGLPVQQKTLEKVRKQLGDVSALVDLWWQGVRQSAASQVVLTPMWRHWIETLLLPLMYWQERVSRTREPRRKAELVHALQTVQEAFEAHPLTRYLSPEILADWKQWAMEDARAFQRASSAVEGRNGYLAQLHHNHRGLPKSRYQI